MLHGEFEGTACGPHGPYIPDVLFWCVVLFFSTVFMSAFLKEFKTSRYFPTRVGIAPAPHQIPVPCGTDACCMVLCYNMLTSVG